MSDETLHPLPSGKSVRPSVAWTAIRGGLAVGNLTPAKIDVVLLVSYERTLNQIVTRARAQHANEDAIELMRCGLKYRRDHLEKLAAEQGRENLIEGLYAAEIGGAA